MPSLMEIAVVAVAVASIGQTIVIIRLTTRIKSLEKMWK